LPIGRLDYLCIDQPIPIGDHQCAVNAMTTECFGPIIITQTDQKLKRVFSMKNAWIRLTAEIQSKICYSALVTKNKATKFGQSNSWKKALQKHSSG